MRARAASDAALLYSPTVQAQAIRFPRNGAVDTGLYVGDGVQLRGVVSWSPLDAYRGTQIESAADRDCEQHAARATAAEILAFGVEYGRLPALRREAGFLESKRSSWETVAKESDARLEQQVITLLEANEVRARASELARRSERARADVAHLESRHVDEYRRRLATLSAEVEATSMQYEKQVSHVRSLDAWSFTVAGGIVPHAEPVDWFGSVSVGFNFGAFSRNANETKYLAARQRELTGARYELGDQLRRFDEQIAIELATSKRELALAERKVASLETVKRALAGAENSPKGPHALALVELESIVAESERLYLVGLVSELERISHAEDKSK